VAPTKVVKGVRGNRYTAEDKKYFAKYVSWALQDDPSLTKGEIIARLAERVRRLQKSAIGFDTSPVQVPHHTANSWASHWHRDPLADRLLTAAKEKTAEIYGNNVKDVGVDDDDDDDDSQDSEETSSCDEEEDDEAAMGGGGSIFGPADIRVMAKHIAKHSSAQWAEMTNKQRWFPFHEEVNVRMLRA
jgi:hypothetical protein